jgi:hypothetical protein
MLPIGSPMHNYRRSSDLLFGLPEHTKISSSCGETLNLPMSPEDAQQLAGTPHNRGGGRVGRRWRICPCRSRKFDPLGFAL